MAAAPPLAVLAAGRTLAWRDTARLFAPLRGLVVDALRSLRLPLWNPHEGLGTPLFAQLMHGVLHPVSIAAAALAPGAGMDPLLVAHVALAAAGAALLARALGATRPAAAVAGLGFAMSGYVLGMTSNLTYLAAAGTAPWAVAGLRWAAAGGWGRMAVAALGVAALHLAGDPQWTVVAVALGLALAWAGGGGRGVARALAAVALGTLVAAVQLAPAWVLLARTARATPLDAAERTQWSFAPWRALELVAPGLFCGHPGALARSPVFVWLGGPTRHGQTLPFAPSVHVGAVLLGLAALGVAASREGRALGLAVALLAWAALGERAGADALLRHVPVWSAFRYPEKLVGPLTLALATLAALGCDRLALRPSRRAGWIAGAGAAAAALGAALALSPWLADLPGSELARAGLQAARERLAPGLLHPAAALAALAVLLRAATRGGRLARPESLGTALSALVALEAAAAAPFALHPGARGLYEPGPLAALAGATGAPARIATPTEGSAYPLRADLDDADAIAEVEARIGVAPYPARFGIDQLNAYSGLVSGALSDLGAAFARELGPAAWIAYRRYGVTHVAVTELDSADARAAVSGGRLAYADPERGIALFEVPRRPWADFAPAVIPASDRPGAIAAVIAAERRGDPAVVIEGGPAPVARGEVLAIRRGPEDVRIEAAAAADATLVVDDAFWPGWRATVDGRPAPIWRADGLVRAIPWPAGRHVLELRYEPPEVRKGALASGAGLLVVLALAGAALASSRAPRPR